MLVPRRIRVPCSSFGQSKIMYIQFRIEEFVPKKIFDQYGHKAWRFIDLEIVKSAQHIKNHFKAPTICNDWLWGGKMQFRGYRPEWCDIGSKTSLHRLRGALDLTIVGFEPEEVREAIRKNWDKWGIARIEADVNWNHIDRLWYPNQKNLVEF